MPIYLLPEEPVFPDPNTAHSTGLLALGGDLSVERLLAAYSSGIFPWFEDDNEPHWYSPPERCVLIPNNLRISKSMRRLIKQHIFELRIDTNFETVIAHCATIERPDQDGTWITSGIKAAYTQLHHMGYAHSFETYYKGELVGGLYGVALGRVFMGESMFSNMPNASKFAFISMVEMLTAKGFHFIDCQVYNSHLESLGATVISRREFLNKLQIGLNEPSEIGVWNKWVS